MEQSPLLPLREELAQVTPYGAPQLEVSARLNVNENPYSPSLEMITD
ncbi:MAG: histidinol-phosphate transaminase, partial [Varibaculum cambriense]|nr:histidinol-phosphate transaminase [Varibaculum cambriense]